MNQLTDSKKEQKTLNEKLQNLEKDLPKQTIFIPYGGNKVFKWKRATKKKTPVVKWTHYEKN